MDTPYDAKEGLQSLLGYAKPVHERFGGACQYFGYGVNMEASTNANFDIWRQLTVEHFISEKNGGYLYRSKSQSRKSGSRLSVEQQIQ